MRRIWSAIRERKGRGSRNIKGAGLSILSAGQEILKRSSVDIDGNILTFRFYINLPAGGRTILGKEDQNRIFNEVVKMVRVLMLDEYRVVGVTKRAKEIDNRYIESKVLVSSDEFRLGERVLDSKKTPLLFSDKKCKIKGRELDELSINRESVDIRYLEQLVKKGQVLFIGEVMKKVFTLGKGTSLKEALDEVEIHLKKDNICEYLKCDKGNLVFSRKYEIGAAVNRLRKEIFL